ncbi:MAG: hypothetical protein E7370_00705 [Clostridiales bacterium]|nr:hypothetical protein [Clostridiales bacterium]
MGHSAGGHLALLYAYMSAEGTTVIDPDSDTEQYFTLSPVQLVIYEAGPIQFATSNNALFTDNFICAMAGINPNTANGVGLSALVDASPYCVAQGLQDKSTLPYTILAYGKGIISATGEDGDGLVPIKPALDLYNSQTDSQKTLEDLGNNSGCFSSSNNDNCVLYYFYEIGHNDFSLKNKVHPFTELENPELKEVILCYYDKINEKLNPSISN